MKKIFVVLFIITINFTVYSQNDEHVSFSSNQISLSAGLPSNSFFDNLKKEEHLYSNAEFVLDEFTIHTIFLRRTRRDGGYNYYIVCNKDSKTLVSKSITPLKSNADTVSFIDDVEINETNYHVSINMINNETVVFSFVKISVSPTKLEAVINGRFEFVLMHKRHSDATYYSFEKRSSFSEYETVSLNYLPSVAILVKAGQYFALDFRLGIATFERPYQGLELGFFGRFYLLRDLYSYLGAIGHAGTEGDHGRFYGGSGFAYALGLGYGITKSLAVTAAFHSVNDIVSHNTFYEGPYEAQISRHKKWLGLFNFGIEYNY